MTAESTRWHEAAHASACVLLGRPVEYVAASAGHGFVGEQVGSVSAPIPDELKRRDLVAALVGYLADVRTGLAAELRGRAVRAA